MPLILGSHSRCNSAFSGWFAPSSKIGSNRNSPSSKRPPGSHSTCRKNSGLRPLKICSVSVSLPSRKRVESIRLHQALSLAIILPEGLVDGGAELVAQRLEFGPQLLRAQLGIEGAGELRGAKPSQVGGKAVQFRPALTGAQARVVGDFLEMPGEGGVIELAQARQIPERSASGCRSGDCRSRAASREWPLWNSTPAAAGPGGSWEWNRAANTRPGA